MRSAPAVQVDVPRCGAWLGFITAVGATAAAVLVAWVFLQLESPVAWPAAGIAWCCVALLAWRFTPIDCGALIWDGAQWRFNDAPGDLSLQLDLGGWVLMRFDAATPRRRAWLAMGATEAAAAWHGLRAAVYCRRPEPDPDSESPSAKRM